MPCTGYVLWTRRSTPAVRSLCSRFGSAHPRYPAAVRPYHREGQGRFEPRDRETCHRGGGYVEVREGVAEGEPVVVSANFLIDAESNLKAALRAFSDAEHSNDPPPHRLVGAQFAAGVFRRRLRRRCRNLCASRICRSTQTPISRHQVIVLHGISGSGTAVIEDQSTIR